MNINNVDVPASVFANTLATLDVDTLRQLSVVNKEWAATVGKLDAWTFRIQMGRAFARDARRNRRMYEFAYSCDYDEY